MAIGPKTHGGKMASEPKTYGGKLSQIQLSIIPGQYSASLNGYPENYYLPIVFYVRVPTLACLPQHAYF
jgi:hypothetical protein